MRFENKFDKGRKRGWFHMIQCINFGVNVANPKVKVWLLVKNQARQGFHGQR